MGVAADECSALVIGAAPKSGIQRLDTACACDLATAFKKLSGWPIGPFLGQFLAALLPGMAGVFELTNSAGNCFGRKRNAQVIGQRRGLLQPWQVTK